MDMSMDMSGMTMSSSTTGMAGMSMTTSSAMSMSTGMDMSGMDMSSTSSMMPASDMAMVFFQAIATPLWAMSWTPSSTGTYAGTCIFLIFLSVMHRVLIAVRSVAFKPAVPHRARDEEEDRLSGKEVAALQAKGAWAATPFRVATESARAGLEVVIGGVGYLLMLAVMTMNVGYFLSVLGGIFLGVFIVGRFGATDH